MSKACCFLRTAVLSGEFRDSSIRRPWPLNCTGYFARWLMPINLQPAREAQSAVQGTEQLCGAHSAYRRRLGSACTTSISMLSESRSQDPDFVIPAALPRSVTMPEYQVPPQLGSPGVTTAARTPPNSSLSSTCTVHCRPRTLVAVLRFSCLC